MKETDIDEVDERDGVAFSQRRNRDSIHPVIPFINVMRSSPDTFSEEAKAAIRRHEDRSRGESIPSSSFNKSHNIDISAQKKK
jgi:hypothetical protein